MAIDATQWVPSDVWVHLMPPVPNKVLVPVPVAALLTNQGTDEETWCEVQRRSTVHTAHTGSTRLERCPSCDAACPRQEGAGGQPDGASIYAPPVSSRRAGADRVRGWSGCFVVPDGPGHPAPHRGQAT